jgi:hypothetical protein
VHRCGEECRVEGLLRDLEESMGKSMHELKLDVQKELGNLKSAVSAVRIQCLGCIRLVNDVRDGKQMVESERREGMRNGEWRGEGARSASELRRRGGVVGGSASDVLSPAIGELVREVENLRASLDGGEGKGLRVKEGRGGECGGEVLGRLSMLMGSMLELTSRASQALMAGGGSSGWGVSGDQVSELREEVSNLRGEVRLRDVQMRGEPRQVWHLREDVGLLRKEVEGVSAAIVRVEGTLADLRKEAAVWKDVWGQLAGKGMWAAWWPEAMIESAQEVGSRGGVVLGGTLPCVVELVGRSRKGRMPRSPSWAEGMKHKGVEYGVQAGVMGRRGEALLSAGVVGAGHAVIGEDVCGVGAVGRSGRGSGGH